MDTALLAFVAALALAAPAVPAQSARPAPSSADAAAPVDAQELQVRVDPRVELLTIVARLAEFPEFHIENAGSPYAERVEKHFGGLRSHAAVKALQALRASRGVSHDAIPSLAVHLGGLDGAPATVLGERVPFDAPPERLDARWGGAGAREFLVELRDFASASDGAAFFEGERAYYAQVEQRLAERLAQSKALPWFDGFFGARKGSSYVAIAGLLCGGGNFGVGVRFPDGRPEEITPVFGCWTWDAEGLPVFGEVYLPLFVHELCHSYTNPFVDAHAAELEPIAAQLYATCAATMAPQAYSTGMIVLKESLVRASVVRCRLATEGKEAAQAQAAEEVGHGFNWVPKLAMLLGEYEADRTQWPDFEPFMPKVVAFFAAVATEQAALAAAAPQLLEMSPALGATDVDPALTALTFRFDRPMRDQSWSIVGSAADTPAITGKPAYDAVRTVLTLAVKLEPGRTYRFALNGPGKQGFSSADGAPLAPVAVTFRTRG